MTYILYNGRYWDPYYYRRRRMQTDDDKMNFIESVCDANEWHLSSLVIIIFLFLIKNKDFDLVFSIGLLLCIWRWWSQSRNRRREMEVGNNWGLNSVVRLFWWLIFRFCFCSFFHCMLLVLSLLKVLQIIPRARTHTHTHTSIMSLLSYPIYKCILPFIIPLSFYHLPNHVYFLWWLFYFDCLMCRLGNTYHPMVVLSRLKNLLHILT